MAVKRSFSSAIVYSRRLSKGKVDLMVLFMVDNHCDLFKVSDPMKRQLFTEDCFFLKQHNQFQTASRKCGPSVLCSYFPQTDSRFIAQVGQRQNNEYHERERSKRDNRFADSPFPPCSFRFFFSCRFGRSSSYGTGQLSCLMSPRRLSVLHEGDCKGLLRKRTKMHQRGTLVFAAHNPREPQTGRQGEEEAPGTVL